MYHFTPIDIKEFEKKNGFYKSCKNQKILDDFIASDETFVLVEFDDDKRHASSIAQTIKNRKMTNIGIFQRDGKIYLYRKDRVGLIES